MPKKDASEGQQIGLRKISAELFVPPCAFFAAHLEKPFRISASIWLKRVGSSSMG